MFDVLIKNGTVVDGTGAVPFKANVAIKEGKITMLMKCEEPEAKEVIDAAGKHVCPGFVDPHSHGDLVLGKDYALLCKTMQGITTESAGQCGNSLFPTTAENHHWAVDYNPLHKTLGNEITGTFASFRKWMDSIPKTAHIKQFVGHNLLRLATMGRDDREPTAAELENMKSLLREAMESGAAGMTTGLIYAPGCFANQKEVTELCKVVAEFGGLYTSHMRSEGSDLVGSVREALETTRDAGCRLLISHHKACGYQNWGQADAALTLTDAAFDAGQEVAFDVYPYPASMTGLGSYLPPEELTYPREERTAHLQDPVKRAEIRKQLESGVSDVYTELKGDFSDVLMVYCTPAAYQGKTIAQIAEEEGKDPFDAFCDILIANNCGSSAAYFTQSEENLAKFFTHRRAMLGTDGLVYSMTAPTHPRGCCSFPHAINYFVKEKKLLTLEEAIRKMTSFPAQWLKLDRKGVLKDGFDADIVIIDFDTIKGGFTFGEPIAPNPGIEQVIVDGVTVFKDGALTDARPGRVLLHR